MRAIKRPDQYLPQIESFDHGVFMLKGHQERAHKTLQSIEERQRDLVRVRFEQGAIIDAIMETSKYGDSTMDRLSQATGISMAILYDCRKFYLLPDFNKSLDELEFWFNELQGKQKRINWAYCRQLLRPGRTEAEAKVAELHGRARKMERDAMELEQEVENVAWQAAPHAEAEVMGITAQATQVAIAAAQETRHMAETMLSPKPQRIEDEQYRAFVRKHPCLITGQDAQAHHFLTGGMGTKGSDYATVPLSPEAHRELHDIGQKAFQEKYDVDLWKAMAYLMHMYFVGVKPE